MKNISGEFTEEALQVVDPFLKAHYNADLSQLGILKPFGLLSMVILKAIPCEKQTSYEQVFIRRAAKRGINLMGLEPVGFQMSLFDEVPMQDQINMLVESIRDLGTSQEEFKKLVAAYKAEDIYAMQELLVSSPQFAGFEDLFLVKRNKNWIPKIESIIIAMPSFIAVGALHLAATNGLISLLRDEGYTITAVR